MPIVPEFISKKETFESELAMVVDLDSMRAFEKRWFDVSKWPEKTQDQQAAEQSKKRWPVELNGRLWGHTSFLYDITPEARYVYLKYVREVSFPIEFPDFKRDTFDMQDCPFCEISTTDIGDDACPNCARKLVGNYRTR